MAIGTTTALIIAGVTAAVSAGVGAYTSVQAAEAQAKASEYNAKVAENNATMAAQQGREEYTRAKLRSRRIIAAQRAQLAKSGLSISGSALDVLGDTAVQAELDALSAMYRTQVSANQEINESKLRRSEAANARGSKKWAITSSILGATSSGLGIASDYGSVGRRR
jgi:hypothetical protein